MRKLYDYDAEWFSDKERGVVTYVIKYQDGYKEREFVGTAKLCPSDTWDTRIGKQLARQRAQIKFGEFILRQAKEELRKLQKEAWS